MFLHVSIRNSQVLSETVVSYSSFIKKQNLTDNELFIIHFLHLCRHTLKALNLPLLEIITNEYMVICALSSCLFQSIQNPTESTERENGRVNFQLGSSKHKSRNILLNVWCWGYIRKQKDKKPTFMDFTIWDLYWNHGFQIYESSH